MTPDGVAGAASGAPGSRKPAFDGMEAVHVLHRVDRVDDPVLVDLLRQRELHEDPGHARVGVQVGDEREQVLLGGRRAASSWWIDSIPASAHASRFMRT